MRFISKYQYIGVLIFGIVIINAYFMYSRSRADGFNEKGISYLNEGRYAEAINTFKKASSMPGLSNDLRITILRNLAVAYESSKNPEKAIEYYDRAASITEKDSYMYYICMAEIAMLRGNIKIAIENLNKALTKNKMELPIYNNLGLIYLGSYGEEYKDPGKALEYNIKAYELSRETAIQFILAKNYFELNDFQNAEFHLRKVTEKVPGESEYHYYLGLTQYYLGKNQDAIKHLKIAIEINPNLKTDEVNIIINNSTSSPGALDIPDNLD